MGVGRVLFMIIDHRGWEGPILKDAFHYISTHRGEVESSPGYISIACYIQK